MTDQEITITLHATASGQSETISVGLTSTTVQDLMEWSKALLNVSDNCRIFKDGRPLLALPLTLQQAGLVHGDVLAVQDIPAPTPPTPAPSGGLDFSSLFASAPAPAVTTTTTASLSTIPEPVYIPGMNVQEAMAHNPHPQQFMTLLFRHDHLFKELNYYSPQIAVKLKGQSLDVATRIWREELVKGSIRTAVAQTQTYRKEEAMRSRIKGNPNDDEAKQYFQKQDNQKLIQLQYQSMMEEYPEAMGRVLMLYVEAKVNGNSIQAFVDSGAQSTIMSYKCAQQCGVDHLIDERFAGVAVGVGTGKILGRIHICSLQIGGSHFPCSLTVMADAQLGDKNMDFLLGLDMLKRHTCQIDLEKGVLRFKLGPGEYMDAPFLHEKDLDESKGGTKGFNAEEANQKLLERQQENNDNSDGKDDTMEDD